MKINEKLFNIIDKYISQEDIGFKDFYEKFESLYMDDSFDKEFENISEEDNNFFADIWNKAEWTIENPQKQDLKDGYLNYDSFYEWLRKKHNSKTLDKKKVKKRIKFRYIYIPIIIIIITLIIYMLLPKGADIISSQFDNLLGKITFNITWIALSLDIFRYFLRKKNGK